MHRFECRLILTGPDIKRQLNGLDAEGWQMIGPMTKKQVLAAPPGAIIVSRETQRAAHAA